MHHTKPVYLNLLTFKFPFTAFISIMHRITGICLFFCIPVFLNQLDVILNSSATRASLKAVLLNRPEEKIILWLGLTAFGYHLFAGLRHLVMDFGYTENQRAATITGYVVMMLTIFTGIMCGYAIW